MAVGQQELASSNNEFNALMFVISRALAEVNVATLVRVVAVYPGGIGAVGTVDVLPLVSQVAGDGTVIPHTTVYGLPYLRIQGGTNAVIIDPEVDDIGFCIFADRDIGPAQSALDQAPPGSERRFSMADGLYIGGWCANLTPINRVQITGNKIDVVASAGAVVTVSVGSSVSMVMTNTDVTINGNTKIVGSLEVTGAAVFDDGMSVTGNASISGDVTGSGTSLHTHIHSGVTVGGGDTGAPI